MYYWNKENFEGLRHIGQTYATRAGFAGFSQYCLLREKGLKKPAFKALDEFLAATRSLEVTQQRAITCEIADLAFSHGDTHQLLSYALTSFLRQVLRAWCDEGPALAEPYRWLGKLTGESAWLQAALAHDPQDQVALHQLANDELMQVDHMAHHLEESVFLGDEAVAAIKLDRAAALAVRIESEQARNYLNQEVRELRELLAAWNAYRVGERTIEFVDWCDVQGLSFRFSTAFYYTN
ncbi:hypothetical protein G3435_05450 [Pseudomonas sp. MAFF212428]|uniref:Uncharacterized protein n=1 Tax=Pseudomonas brassicae TaxID=2708063 RepID=A0A6B3NTW4_9PSED|nr:hypothetical protein [Pseudomonas brassicae]NER59586.1 hypothetical protein [Pseudomonas brassicae]NER63710.1 hypothetical protein [Pseudomonas brassicae]